MDEQEFKPMQLRNLKLQKKYFKNHHKNRSSFNAYSDYLTNMKEFKKTKEMGNQPSKF